MVKIGVDLSVMRCYNTIINVIYDIRGKFQKKLSDRNRRAA